MNYFILDTSGGEEAQRRVRTLYACVGEHDSELSFEPNQVITDGESAVCLHFLRHFANTN